MQHFAGFNDLPDEETESMLQFHIYAANIQLRQLYYGFMAAAGLNRVLVLPTVGLMADGTDRIQLLPSLTIQPSLLVTLAQLQCHCAKNWKETVRCRVYGERHSTFPFNCSLSQLLRAKRLLQGITVVQGNRTRTVIVRERTFLENPNVPNSVKVSGGACSLSGTTQ